MNVHCSMKLAFLVSTLPTQLPVYLFSPSPLKPRSFMFAVSSTWHAVISVATTWFACAWGLVVIIMCVARASQVCMQWGRSTILDYVHGLYTHACVYARRSIASLAWGLLRLSLIKYHGFSPVCADSSVLSAELDAPLPPSGAHALLIIRRPAFSGRYHRSKATNSQATVSILSC